MTPEIKEKLLGLINEKAYNPLKKEELALIFDIHSCEMPMFNNFLEELQDEGYLIVSKKGRVMAPSAMKRIWICRIRRRIYTRFIHRFR